MKRLRLENEGYISKSVQQDWNETWMNKCSYRLTPYTDKAYNGQTAHYVIIADDNTLEGL